MEPVKLLALDLDGTLLNSQKELTAGHDGTSPPYLSPLVSFLSKTAN